MFEWPSRKEVPCLTGTFFQRIAHLLGGWDGEGTCKLLGDPAELFPPLWVGLGDVCGLLDSSVAAPILRAGMGLAQSQQVGTQQTRMGNRMNASNAGHLVSVHSSVQQTVGMAALGQVWVLWTWRNGTEE